MMPLRPRRAIFFAPALLAADNPESTLAAATSFDEANFLALRAYVWNSEEVSFRGRAEDRQQKYEINMLSGAMYWKKLEHMRQPLTGVQAEMEAQRLKQHLAQPRSLDGFPPDNGWRFERSFLEELPRLHRIENYEKRHWNSTPCHYFQLQPRKDARGQHPLASMLASFQVKLWLAENSLHWVHAEWTTVREVRWSLRQLPLGRLSMVYSNGIRYQGTLRKKQHFQWTLKRLPDGPWVLDEYQTYAGTFRNQLRYFNFRQFRSESELII